MHYHLFFRRLAVWWLIGVLSSVPLVVARSATAQSAIRLNGPAARQEAARLSTTASTDAQPSPVTNATPQEMQAIRALFKRLDDAVVAREAEVLRFFGVPDLPPYTVVLPPQTRLTHVAVTPEGALVRQSYSITGQTEPGGSIRVWSRGAHELWLTRLAGGGFTWTAKRWTQPADAVATLEEAARQEWDSSARPVVSGATSLAAPRSEATPKVPLARPALLHLVAERRGGRWIALRRSRWDGALFDSPGLAARQRQNENAGAGNVALWLEQQIARLPAETGEAHFLLQNGSSGWVGVGTAWEALPHLASGSEAAVTRGRRQLQDSLYLSATAHRDFGLTLQSVGLYVEASDELEKANYLQPRLVDESVLSKVNKLRVRDPFEQSVVRMEQEAKIGLNSEHPAYLINRLNEEFKKGQSPVTALLIGIEYSKLADEKSAGLWLNAADDMMRRGALATAKPADMSWAEILFTHLQERRRLAAWKPSLILRSALFTVRCSPNDPNALQLLAALEAAQHTVYAGFGIPMGNTEVVLWPSQGEFQRYTVQFSSQASSELVAAMTLTKLMTTASGPVVLGAELNAFVDKRADFFGTIAHEYGHVAVRNLSRGRLVPIWFNEGIASAVEGGYEGYVPRVRDATARGRLLTMHELLQWNVDGERAFLAYSQANSLVDYIVARWKREAVLEILRQIGQDVPPDAAFINVLGISQQALWKAWLQEGIK